MKKRTIIGMCTLAGAFVGGCIASKKGVVPDDSHDYDDMEESAEKEKMEEKIDDEKTYSSTVETDDLNESFESEGVTVDDSDIDVDPKKNEA